MIVGTGALLAVAAVLALAIGTTLKRSAAAVTTVIAVTFIPFLLAILPTSPLGLREWLLRITPAAAFSVQQAQPSIRRSSPPTRRMPGTTRSLDGRGWRWSARGRPPR